MRTQRITLLATSCALGVALVAGCGSSSDSKSSTATGSAATSGVAATSTDNSAILGKWNVQVQTSLPSSGSALLTFNPDGSLLQAGSDTIPGTGWWQKSIEPNTWTLEVVIPLSDHTTHAIKGTIRGFEKVVLTNGALDATGHAEMYTLEGKKTATFTLHSTADGKS